jgi:hypothetical protein
MARSRSCSLVPLAGFVAVLGGASTASAQHVIWSHPPVDVTATVNKSPTARGQPADHQMWTFRRDGNAVKRRIWSSTLDEPVGSWGSTTTITQSDVAGEPVFGTSMVAHAGEHFDAPFSTWLPRFGVVLDALDSSSRHRMFRALSTFAWGTSWEAAPVGSAAFQPFSSFTWRQANTTHRVNAFGLNQFDFPFGQTLAEHWFDGSTWRFTDHGRPRIGDTAAVFDHLNMGPGATVWSNPNGLGRGWVFVTADDLSLEARKWGGKVCDFDDGLDEGRSAPANTTWCWQSLRMPDDISEMRTPVAVGYQGDKVMVFVAAKSNGLSDPFGWTLYGRHFDGTEWHEWENFGRPPARFFPRGGELDGFDLTAGAVFTDNSGRLRINIFGTTTPIDEDSAGLPIHDGGRLIEFYWDGTTWSWGNPILTPATQWIAGRHEIVRIQTMDVEVVDAATWDRISVIARDELGRVWEYVFRGTSWSWQQI